MWEELSKAKQDAIAEAHRVASKPGQHQAAARRLTRAFPGLTEERALRAILDCMESVTPPRELDSFKLCMLGRLRV
jgi:hypothetical protein